MNLFDLILKVWHFAPMKGLLLNIAKLFPDKQYIRLIFLRRMGYRMNFDNPKTFNEKLNWMKLYHRIPRYSLMADKYEVKKIVSANIGDQYVVENYGCWNSFDDINFESLPNQFVLKCNHNSGGAIICKDKKSFDYQKAKQIINISLKKNYFNNYREWPYKNIKPKIIADKYLDDHSGRELNDYKFWCFNGVPKYMYCTVKTNKEQIFENFYDMEFNEVPINHGFPRRDPEFEKPAAFELMKDLARKLSKGIPFVRIDFFYVDNRVYFGEYTFYDWAGLQPFSSYEMDLKLGELINLPEKNKAF